MAEKLPVLAKNKSFCVRPFLQYSAFNGLDYRLCCSAARPNPPISTDGLDIKEFFNSNYLKDVRQKMIAGEYVDECRSCYLLEESDTPSDRTVSNQNLIPRYQDSLERAVECPDLEVAPIILDLRVGNLCNLRCQSCFPNLSQGVYEDIKNYFGTESSLRSLGDSKPLLQAGFELDQLKTLLPAIKEIKLIGGEPSLSKPARELLQYCISKDFAKGIELHVHTNLASNQPEFFEILRSFKRVRLTMSLDGFGKMNEYLRFPSRWESSVAQLYRIIEDFKESKNIKLAFSPVLQVTNLFDITNLLTFLFDEVKIVSREIDLAPIPLTDPAYLSAYYFPKKLLAEARLNFDSFYQSRTTIEQNVLTPFKVYFDGLDSGQPQANLIRDFVEVSRTYDRGRGQNIQNVFPEFQTLLSFLDV